MWYLIGRRRSSEFPWSVWNCAILYINIMWGIVTVTIQIITVKLLIIMFIYMTIPHTSWECWRPQLSNDVLHNDVHAVLELHQLNCDMYFKIIIRIMGTLTVSIWIFTIKMHIIMTLYHSTNRPHGLYKTPTDGQIKLQHLPYKCDGYQSIHHAWPTL